MQITQARSSSKQSHKCARESPEPREKTNTYLIASKMGDLSQRNLTTACSKELDSKKMKNMADNTEYIRNLYKKYLGKENNGSDRKTKTELKDQNCQKVMPMESCRQKLVYPPETQFNKRQSAAQRICTQGEPRKVSRAEWPQPRSSNGNRTIEVGFYKKNIDNELVNSMGKSSLVAALHLINSVRNKYG